MQYARHWHISAFVALIVQMAFFVFIIDDTRRWRLFSSWRDDRTTLAFQNILLLVRWMSCGWRRFIFGLVTLDDVSFNILL